MKKRGTTLLEIVMVLVMMGVLASLALPQYTGFVEKTRANEALAGIALLKDAELNYKTMYGAYTASDALVTATGLPTHTVAGANPTAYYWSYSVNTDADTTRFTVGAIRQGKNVPAGVQGKYLQCWFFEDGTRQWVGTYTEVQPKN